MRSLKSLFLMKGWYKICFILFLSVKTFYHSLEGRAMRVILFLIVWIFIPIRWSGNFLQAGEPTKTSAPSPENEKRRVEAQMQSESFLKLISPENLSKDPRLKVNPPSFDEMVYFWGDDKRYTAIPRSAVLWMPREGETLKLAVKPEDRKLKMRVDPESFIQEHRRLFDLVAPVDGKNPILSSEQKDPRGKIVVLYERGKIVTPSMPR